MGRNGDNYRPQNGNSQYRPYPTASAMPPSMQCSRCDETKPIQAFSKRQQGIYLQKRGTQLVFCIGCGPQIVTEIKCGGPCNKTKDRAEFSKSQASKGDEEARCISCVRLREGTEAYKGEPEQSAAARILGDSIDQPAAKVGKGGFVKVPAYKKEMPSELDLSDSDNDVYSDISDSDASASVKSL
ncbi:hypothetical protein MBLNU457_g0537t1 [Dothideomycetes sp. NU457]